MIFASFLITLATCLAKPNTDVTPPPTNIDVYAVYATHEPGDKTYFDPGLDPIRNAVADLGFNHYKKLEAKTITATFNKETEISVNPRYTLCIEPLNKDDDGRIRLNVRVAIAPRFEHEPPRNAVQTTIVMAPGSQFKFRGLKMDQGELVLILALKPNENT